MLERWIFICCVLLAVSDGAREREAICENVVNRLGIDLKTLQVSKWIIVAVEHKMLRSMVSDRKEYFVLTPKGRLGLVKYRKSARLMVKAMQSIQEGVDKVAV